MLVAVFMLFVVGAMAALAIDVVTLYTARSEAQLAADGAALAGGRALANSGATSDTTGALMPSAQTLANAVAKEVAEQNQVGGANVASGQVTVSFAGTDTNPTVTVRVERTDLPTFFARIWGRKQIAVSASATAEVYNPSGAYKLEVATTRVAPMCVKPWLLPNISPTPGNSSTLKIFDPATGAVLDLALLGWETTTIPPQPPPPPPIRLRTACSTNCDPSTVPAPKPWRYYPGTTDATGSFPAPSASSVVCPSCTTPYELSIAGCVQTPISCNGTVQVDTNNYPTRDTETAAAVDDLTHSSANGGDSVDTTAAPSPPFQFLAGAENPVPGAAGNVVMVSDSMVTVPVINVDSTTTPWPPAGYPSVQIIGFVQLFLNPTGAVSPANGHIRTQVINLAGCGLNATGTPILGNGASPVTVRLISPP